MADKLAFTLNVTDIFKSRLMNMETNLSGNMNVIQQYHGASSVWFSLHYRFSKGSSSQATTQNVHLNELNRAGGNQ